MYFYLQLVGFPSHTYDMYHELQLVGFSSHTYDKYHEFQLVCFSSHTYDINVVVQKNLSLPCTMSFSS